MLGTPSVQIREVGHPGSIKLNDSWCVPEPGCGPAHSHLPVPCHHLDSVRGIGKIQENSLSLPSCCQCTKVVNSLEVIQRQSEGPKRGSKLAKVTQRARSKARSDSLFFLSPPQHPVFFLLLFPRCWGTEGGCHVLKGLLCARHCTRNCCQAGHFIFRATP